MHRYLVTRTFPEGFHIPPDADGRAAIAKVVTTNAEADVNWVHSYVSSDRRKTFCVYDGPNADAIRESARTSNLPIDAITPVSVLDPYFYRG